MEDERNDKPVGGSRPGEEPAEGLQKDEVVLDQWGDAARAAATASSRELTPRA
jgi:hypothetical protein